MSFWSYLFGPALFRVYRTFEKGEPYVGNTFERYGSNILFCMTLAYNIGIYFIPPWLGYQILSRRAEFFQLSTISHSTRYISGVGCVLVVAVLLRAIGRASNPIYREFIYFQMKAFRNPTEANKAKLRLYDAEFSAYPIDFSMKTGLPSKLSYLDPPSRGTPLQTITQFPHRIIAWLMTQTFGLKLVYPGSIQLLQAGIREPLEEGRAKWVMEKRGHRYKLQTIDNNEIDSMFFDRRGSLNPNGNILVIACEGNAGFYEIGVVSSPLDAGYSVLGWNHPGFGGSTGSPFPTQETNAMDAVVQFALQKLNFKPEQIVLHGWSIGGFPVGWAAMNYPDVKAVILDATFDNLLPLAVERMPQFLETMVRIAIEDYINLDIEKHINKYQGPIRLIRRSHDEIITTRMGDRGSNRGNFLLVSILEHRYPEIFGAKQVDRLFEYLRHDEPGQRNFLEMSGVVDAEMNELIQSHSDEDNPPRTFPSTLGQDLQPETKTKLALYLASRYMTDFDSTHCNPLPANLFTLPWEHPVSSQNDFVKI